MNDAQSAGSTRAEPTPPGEALPHGSAPDAVGPLAHPEVSHHCGNCTTVLIGSYCHACGQPGHLHRSLLHMVEEVLHGVLHFDTKAWRTLPLLVARPGLLTRRYIDGQRTRHVSPLALFLFMMFLGFLVISWAGSPGVPWTTEIATLADEQRAELVEAEGSAQREMARLAREWAAARREQRDLTQATQDLTKGRDTLHHAQAALQAFDATAPEQVALGAAQASSVPAVTVNTGSLAMDHLIERVRTNPELAFYKLKNTAYKFSFLLVPLLLPFLWLMFLGKRSVVVYDHAVFALYSLSFMSLLVVTTALLSLTPLSGHLGWMLWLVPLHVFFHLRGTYALTLWGAYWRTTALVGVAGVVCALFLMFSMWMSWH
jgi:hypothetical protein